MSVNLHLLGTTENVREVLGYTGADHAAMLAIIAKYELLTDQSSPDFVEQMDKMDAELRSTPGIDAAYGELETGGGFGQIVAWNLVEHLSNPSDGRVGRTTDRELAARVLRAQAAAKPWTAALVERSIYALRAGKIDGVYWC